jgi:hypothetical protein
MFTLLRQVQMNMRLLVAASFVCCAPLTTIGARAQTPHTRNTVAELAVASPSAIIRLLLDGEVAVHSWDHDRIEVRVEDVVTGRVIGYSNEANRGPYEVSITPTNSGFVIAPQARSTPVSIGFNSVREHLHHDIYLPASAHICLRLGDGDVSIDGHFASVEMSGAELRHAITLEDRPAGAAPAAKSSCGVR